MGKWWILPEALVTELKQAFIRDSDNSEFQKNSLEKEMNVFIDKELEILDPELYRDIKKVEKRPSNETLIRAINERQDNGVFVSNNDDKSLLNLLCYFACNKNWNNTLKKFALSEDDIEKENPDKRKQRLKGDSSALDSNSNEEKLQRIKQLKQLAVENAKLVFPDHDDYFVYFYETFDETEDRFYAKFALIGFNIENGEWKTGKVYYLNEFNLIHKVFDLNRISPPVDNSKTLYFSASYEKQVNFFTIKVNDKSRNLRLMLPLTYSVTETQDGYPCAGKAVLEKIPKNEYEKKIFDLLNGGIGSGVVNYLHLVKYVLQEKVQDKSSALSNKQTAILKGYKGIWCGAYFRSDFEGTPANKKKMGGICKFVMHIRESGLCQLYYDMPNEETEHNYNGFIEFPYNDKALMKISLEYLNNNKTYRIFCFLEPRAVGKSIPAYAGVMSGWTNTKKIYSSIFYMEYITPVKGLSEEKIIEKIVTLQPKRVAKTEMLRKRLSKVEKGYITALKAEEHHYLSVFKNCTPSS